MDTSGYQVSDLDLVDLYWGKDQLDVDIVFRPGIYTPYPSSTFNDFEMGSIAENLNLSDQEEDKDTSPPPNTPVSERPTHPLALLRRRPFGTRIENVPHYVHRELFE